jgi:hypothetical protein
MALTGRVQSNLSRWFKIRRPWTNASGGSGAWPAAARDAAALRRRAAAQRRIRCWGSPIGTGFAPGQRQAPGELSGDLPGRRQRGVTACGEQPRWRSSGEVEGALGHVESRAKSTSVLLTFTRFGWQAPQWRTGDGRAATAELKRGDRLGLGR